MHVHMRNAVHHICSFQDPNTNEAIEIDINNKSETQEETHLTFISPQPTCSAYIPQTP